MHSGPSGTAETIVAVLVPPACREEVVGDLHERFKSPAQYTLDALTTVPLVILSRIRRTADPQVLLMQAFAFYISFSGSAWFTDRALLSSRWGLLRLSTPALMAILGLILEDAYAIPGPRSTLSLARGPVIGLLFALASQGVFRILNPDLALPGGILFYGCAFSFPFSYTIRLSFPPVTAQLKGVNAPAEWLKQSGGTRGRQSGVNRSRILLIATVAVLVIAYRIWKA